MHPIDETCINTQCVNLIKRLLVQVQPDPVYSGSVGPQRDGLACGSEFVRTVLPSESLVSPENGQMGYSGNHNILGRFGRGQEYYGHNLLHSELRFPDGKWVT
jgi:hypothetical protein